MTASERKMLNRGVAAGTMLGLAIGLMLALAIAMRPELFAALLR
jgi:tetrahydromethanopterin S-methyltransferase subunit F